ncbi:MAG: fumarylacetoacetase [Proteobacteria bacterium]|nr:fumarylacetoacetase [Pseudomonadota bacterium]MDA0982533.1 fumarylacetoacetase [Pseudomonadota bacterium]
MNATHNPKLRSWVESANDPASEFPIQNLPFGVFRRKGSTELPRGGVAIGDQILDLAAVGLKTGPNLNKLAAAGRKTWRELRKLLSQGLSDPRNAKRLSRYLVPMRQAELFLPTAIGDYSDFYTGIHHAVAVGKIFRPDNPLLPNYQWVPIGYHGRASSVVVSGTPVTRPNGQTKAPDAAAPLFGPSKRLDFELELGLVIGPGNPLGKPVPIKRAMDHVFGVVLLNDWSARDIQAWEYQPLGPFLAKSFATTVSSWVVTMEALEPFRCPAFERGGDQPKPLPYLYDEADQREGGFAIEMEMHLRSARMRAQKLPAQRLTRSSFRHSFWTAAQIVTHQASNGCNLQPGDLLGSGTISGPTPDALGSMLELTQAGKVPVALPGGETRVFIEDGDEVILRSRCVREGFVPIGFGAAAGVIRPAPAQTTSTRA